MMMLYRFLTFVSCAVASSLAIRSGSGVFGVSRSKLLSTSTSSSSLFAVPRGGGLFGGNKEDKKDETATGSDAADSSGAPTKYPAMSREEIEDWLEHIPVFAVTDSNGAGVVLRPENDTSVFYFFLNPMQANATLHQLLSANQDMDLKVSAFSLGKIWFNLLQSDGEDKEVLLKQPESSASAEKDDDTATAVEASTTTTTKNVEYRLVPDTRDLLGARMLLTMSPEDGEKLKESGGMTPEMAQAAIKKAMEESPKFKATYNEIPVFTIAQMRMQKQADPASGSSDEDPVTLLPMYFSMQNMVGTWQEFMKQAPSDVQGVEPAINLMSLHELVNMMQKESEIDWRHVVLVPLAPSSGGAEGATAGATTTAAATDPMAQMGGATLGDD